MTTTIHAYEGAPLTDQEIEPWRNVPVAIAVDKAPQDQIDIRIRPINPPGRQPRLFGRAVTALCTPMDIGATVHAMERIGPDDVLVISAEGRDDAAMIGGILCGHVRARGGAGVICDGAVRDVMELAEWTDFSVFARFINPRGPDSIAHGDVNLAIPFAGKTIRPGDLIIGDDDGLVALSPDSVRNLIGDAKAKLALEDKWIAGLASGARSVDVFGIEPPQTKG